MADGGQGFLKICGIFLPENYHPQLDRAVTSEEKEAMEVDDDNGHIKKELSIKMVEQLPKQEN